MCWGLSDLVDKAEKVQVKTDNPMVTQEVKVLTVDRLSSPVPKWLWGQRIQTHVCSSELHRVNL